MTTTETVLLIVTGSLLSIFIVMCIAIAVSFFKLISGVRRVIVRAEEVIDSVESAADVFKNVSKTKGTLQLIKNIMDIVNRSRK